MQLFIARVALSKRSLRNLGRLKITHDQRIGLLIPKISILGGFLLNGLIFSETADGSYMGAWS